MRTYFTLLACSIFIFACSIQHSSEENAPQVETLDDTTDTVEEANTIDKTDTVDISLYDIVGLPCPNSSTHAGGPWTYEEAGARKGEIYDMALTPKYFRWDNPTSGGAVHINKKDEIEVYQFTFGIFREADSQIVDMIPEYKDTFVVMSVEEVKRNVQGVGYGNETSILITSELDLKKSKSFPKVLEELFHPGDQIYYLKEK